MCRRFQNRAFSCAIREWHSGLGVERQASAEVIGRSERGYLPILRTRQENSTTAVIVRLAGTPYLRTPKRCRHQPGSIVFLISQLLPVDEPPKLSFRFQGNPWSVRAGWARECGQARWRAATALARLAREVAVRTASMDQPIEQPQCPIPGPRSPCWPAGSTDSTQRATSNYLSASNKAAVYS